MSDEDGDSLPEISERLKESGRLAGQYADKLMTNLERLFGKEFDAWALVTALELLKQLLSSSVATEGPKRAGPNRPFPSHFYGLGATSSLRGLEVKKR